MAGCYGNDPEDRAREQELFRYLDEEDEDDDSEDEAAYWAEMESDRRREEGTL
jgi:hypothetical protein